MIPNNRTLLSKYWIELVGLSYKNYLLKSYKSKKWLVINIRMIYMFDVIAYNNTNHILIIYLQTE